MSRTVSVVVPVEPTSRTSAEGCANGHAMPQRHCDSNILRKRSDSGGDGSLFHDAKLGVPRSTNVMNSPYSSSSTTSTGNVTDSATTSSSSFCLPGPSRSKDFNISPSSAMTTSTTSATNNNSWRSAPSVRMDINSTPNAYFHSTMNHHHSAFVQQSTLDGKQGGGSIPRDRYKNGGSSTLAPGSAPAPPSYVVRGTGRGGSSLYSGAMGRGSGGDYSSPSSSSTIHNNDVFQYELLEKVRKTRAAFVNIGEEIDEQNKFLDMLQSTIEKATTSVSRTLRKVNKFASSNSSYRHIHVLFLMVILVIIFVYFLIR